MQSPSVPTLSASDAEGIESLGDNCELGFVLREIGYEAGGLFRWTIQNPLNLAKIMNNDFAGLYHFDRLSPTSDGMVTHTEYRIGFHTQMRSADVDGVRSFVMPEDERKAVHAYESGKVDYLISKFKERCRTPGVLFVSKTNSPFSAEAAEKLFAAVERLACAPHFHLLMVTADPEKAGQVENIAPRLMKGFVSRLAPYSKANDVDHPSWQVVLDKALRMAKLPNAKVA